jgi:hypothetical protein
VSEVSEHLQCPAANRSIAAARDLQEYWNERMHELREQSAVVVPVELLQASGGPGVIRPPHELPDQRWDRRRGHTRRHGPQLMPRRFGQPRNVEGFLVRGGFLTPAATPNHQSSNASLWSLL